MCVVMFVAPECSLYLGVKLHPLRGDEAAPDNTNITELMFCSLKCPLQFQINNFTAAPCEIHALPISSYKRIIKVSDITYTQGTHSAISSNCNMNFRTTNVQRGS